MASLLSKFTYRHLKMSHLIAGPMVPQIKTIQLLALGLSMMPTPLKTQYSVLEKFERAHFEGMI